MSSGGSAEKNQLPRPASLVHVCGHKGAETQAATAELALCGRGGDRQHEDTDRPTSPFTGKQATREGRQCPAVPGLGHAWQPPARGARGHMTTPHDPLPTIRKRDE